MLHSLANGGACWWNSLTVNTRFYNNESAYGVGRHPSKSLGGGRVAGTVKLAPLRATNFGRIRDDDTRICTHLTDLKSQVEVWSASTSEVEILDQIREGRLGEHPDQSCIRRVADLDLGLLMKAAAQIRDERTDSSIITFSPKVFIPLTRVCRDSCGYCTFALGPKPGQSVYMTLEEVLKIARDGVAAGCSEALFTLGDKPELRYSQAKQEVRSLSAVHGKHYAFHDLRALRLDVFLQQLVYCKLTSCSCLSSMFSSVIIYQSLLLIS